MVTLVAFALLAATGAVARAAATGRWNRPGALPAGTLAVNVAGCLLLGALRGADLAPATVTLLGTGMVGAFTTFSGFAADAVGLATEGRRGRAGLAAAYVALSLVAGLLAAALGDTLAG
jgi:CrcB protein